MTTTKPTDSTAPEKPSMEELTMSLNGFDEIAIATAFQADISALQATPNRFMRALLFVAKRRDGVKDTEAFKTVTEMPFSEISASFSETAAAVSGKASRSR